MIKRIIKKSVDNKKRFFAVLLAVSAISGTGAYLARNGFGGSSVYRAELFYAAPPRVSVNTAGIPVEMFAWNGDSIKIECSAELPLIILEDEGEITISQDDGFAVSVFTLEVLRYRIKIWLPERRDFTEINVTSAGGDVGIDARGLFVRRISVTAKNGGIRIGAADSILLLNTETGNVDVDYDYFLLPTLIETVSGDVRLSLPDYSSVSLEYSTDAGKFASSFFPGEFDGYAGSVFAARGNYPKRLNVSTKSGDLVIEEKTARMVL
ncbi:MAG: DUF4097 domain-containing protein [Oscillospiraceae bacterium]|jgi:hypothetical protein|nr:DUF4097 domain-containing protein [Oscillospiraceae bacterium]